jgi:hypothetical protein
MGRDPRGQPTDGLATADGGRCRSRAREQFSRPTCAPSSAGRNEAAPAQLLGIHRNTLLARLAVWGVRSAEIVRPLPPAAGGSLP